MLIANWYIPVICFALFLALFGCHLQRACLSEVEWEICCCRYQAPHHKSGAPSFAVSPQRVRLSSEARPPLVFAVLVVIPKRRSAVARATVMLRTPKNKLEKTGKFLASRISAFSNHVSPAIHHDLTIKKPRSAPHFSLKPQQKRPSASPIFYLPVP